MDEHLKNDFSGLAQKMQALTKTAADTFSSVQVPRMPSFPDYSKKYAPAEPIADSIPWAH